MKNFNVAPARLHERAQPSIDDDNTIKVVDDDVEVTDLTPKTKN